MVTDQDTPNPSKTETTGPDRNALMPGFIALKYRSVIDSENYLNQCITKKRYILPNPKHRIESPNITGLLGCLPRFSASPLSPVSENKYHDHPISLEMPLLSLPAELLHEIVRLTIQTPSTFSSSCIGLCCLDFEGPGDCPCTPPAATALAHTCSILRSHTLPPMYASVTVNIAHSCTIHVHLTAWPHIASCVRTLTVFITDARDSQLLHGILRECSNLRDLCLDAAHTTGPFTGTPLIHVSQRSLVSLTFRNFEWPAIGGYLSSTPPSLHTLRLEDPFQGCEMVRTVALPLLAQVQTFICYSAMGDQRHAGRWLSQIVPNATVVDIHLSPVMMSFLHRYAELGTRVTELTVHFLCAQPLFCGTVAKLAPALRRFTAHGGWVCQGLFAADWARIEVMDVDCRGGCKGARAAVVREALMRVVAARPEADVRVSVEGAQGPVWTDGAGVNVAAVEEFYVLQDVWADY